MIVESPPFIFTMMTGFQASLACVLHISCLSLSLSLPHSLSTIPATILPLSVPLSSLSLCHYPPSLCATTLPPSPPSSSLSTMLMPNIVNSSALMMDGGETGSSNALNHRQVIVYRIIQRRYHGISCIYAFIFTLRTYFRHLSYEFESSHRSINHMYQLMRCRQICPNTHIITA